MAAKKSDQRMRWERYLRIQQRVQQRHQKFMYFRESNGPAVYGSYLQVTSSAPEALEEATRELMVRYNHTKFFLRSLKIELSPPEFTIKEIGLLSNGQYGSTVAWRAVSDKPLTIEMQRTVALRRKRARRARLNV